MSADTSTEQPFFEEDAIATIDLPLTEAMWRGLNRLWGYETGELPSLDTKMSDGHKEASSNLATVHRYEVRVRVRVHKNGWRELVLVHNVT